MVNMVNSIGDCTCLNAQDKEDIISNIVDAIDARMERLNDITMGKIKPIIVTKQELLETNKKILKRANSLKAKIEKIPECKG